MKTELKLQIIKNINENTMSKPAGCSQKQTQKKNHTVLK